MSNYLVDGKQIACSDDTTCPYSSICYFPDKTNPTQGLCGCDAEWGNIGPHCDEPSAQTRYKTSGYSIIIGACSILIFFILNDLWQLHKTTGIKKLEARVTSFLACIVSLAGLIAYCSYGMYMLYHPNNISAMTTGQSLKKRDGVLGRSVALMVFIFFFVAAVLNVSILWLEVAIKSRRFKFISNPQLSYRYRIVVFLFDLALGVAVIVMNWVAGSASNVGVGAMVFICVVYTYCAITISRVFNKATSSDQKSKETPSRGVTLMREALIQIRNCAFRVVFCLLVWIACVAVTAVKYPSMRKTVIPKGQVLDFAVMLDVGYLFAVFALASTARYLHKPRKGEKTTGTNQDDDEEENKTTNGRTGTGMVVPVHGTDNELSQKDGPKNSTTDG